MSLIIKDQELEIFNTFISEKNWEKAEKYLTKLNLPKNIELYNQAYLSYLKSDLPQARYLIDKAKYSGMFSEDLIKAEELIQSDLGIKGLENSIGTYDKIQLSLMSVSDLFLPTLSMMIISIGLFSGIKRHWILCVTFLAMACSLFVFDLDLKKNKLFVSTEDQSVLVGPSRIFEQVQVLPKGLKYSISKEVKDWVFIESPKEFRGWVFKNKGIEYERP